MKRFVISIILVVFLVGQPAQGSYFTLSNINQIQESLGDSSSPIPQEDNPEQAYPIEGNSPGESTEGLDPNQTYPIDGLAPDEGDDGAGGPLTFETVEIYSPPSPDPRPLPPRLNVDAEPSIYIEGMPITLSWSVSDLVDTELANLTLRVYLPNGLVPNDPDWADAVSPDGILVLPLSLGICSLALIETLPLSELNERIEWAVELADGVQTIAYSSVSLPTHGLSFQQLTDPANPGDSLLPVTLSFSDESSVSDLLFYIGVPNPQNQPDYSLTANPVEILAVDPLTGTNITHFETPFQLSLTYPGDWFMPSEEVNLQVFYFDEGSRDWLPFETRVDLATHQASIQTYHLTVFDLKVADWQSYIPPMLQSYEVSAFTGAANYNYEIQTFTGAGGLRPSLTLNYNSQVIDEGTGYSQASWVGMGWNLDTGSITRDMHGTDDDTIFDDTFFLNLNGISGRLLPITKLSSSPDVWEYALQDDPSEKVFWNTGTQLWTVQSGDGMLYTFGGSSATAWLRQEFGCEQDPINLNMPWKWGLIETRDRFGNTITTQYQLVKKGTSPADEGGNVYCFNHIDIYPTKISYGAFDIDFVTTPRTDYRISWQHENSHVLFSKVRLSAIDVSVNQQVVKSYLLQYASDNETNNVIMPGLRWQGAAYLTSTLVSIQEVADRTIPNPQGYQPILLDYSGDHLHLTTIQNGYGGLVSFTYTPFYRADDVNKALRSAIWSFGVTHCSYTNNSKGWSGQSTSISCFPTNYNGDLRIAHNGTIPSIAFTTFPEHLFKPGLKLLFYVRAKTSDENFGPSTNFGYRPHDIPPAGETINIPVFGSIPFQPDPDHSGWQHGQIDLTIAPGYSNQSVELYLENQGTLVDDIEVQAYITRYAVSSRTETDTVTNTTATWTYAYPENGFVMNDGSDSSANPYISKLKEFRGFGQVTITQVETGLVTTQNFHQDRLLKGRLESETVSLLGGGCYGRSLYTWSTETMLGHGALAQTTLQAYTDLDITWTRLTQVNTQSYDAASCSSLDTSPMLATRENYTYLPAATAWTERNLNPVSITRWVFDGSVWAAETTQTLTYDPARTFTANNRSFFITGLITEELTSSAAGVPVQQALYEYTSATSYLLTNKRVWAAGPENARQNAKTTFSYLANGNLAEQTTWQAYTTSASDPSGPAQMTWYQYDPVFQSKPNNVYTIQDNITYATGTVYDPLLGLPIQATQANGASNFTVLDALGRVVRTCAAGTVASQTACATGTAYTLQASYHLSEIPPRIHIDRAAMASLDLTYDGFGKLVNRTVLDAMINGVATDWVEAARVYDGLGRLTEVSQAGFDTLTGYDSLSRVISISRKVGNSSATVESFSYNLAELGGGLLAWQKTATDANNHSSIELTDAHGRLISWTPPAGSGPGVTFGYDTLGRLTQTAYGSAVTEISYHPSGLKSSMNDADMGAWSYGYDAQGNLTSQTDAKGQITLIAYDLLNRLIGKSWSGGGSVSYTWDANGDLGYRTGMSDASGETTWDFDPSGRVIAEDKVVLGQQGTTLWAYDAAGRVSTLTYPGGEEVAYTYLPQGGVNTVGNYLAGTTVNANGQKSLLSLGNGTSIAYEYLDWLTDSGRLGKMSVPGLEDLTYTYDGAGNITSITDGQNAGQVQSFGYDALDRLTSASSSAVGNGQYNQTYTYDPSTGNLSYKSDMGSYTYSPTHPHAVTSAGGNAYAYDLNGNITSRTVAGQVWTYTYDAENHLTATRRNGDLVSEYGYDGDGNRVWAKDYENGLLNPYHITVYIGDTSELSWEEGVPNQGGQTPDCSTSNCVYLPLLVRGAEPTSYYYADGTRIAMRVGREVYYLYGDQLGSTVVTTDVDGGLVSQTLYEPWGEARYQSGTGPTDYAFTGQMQEGDIYFYNARWYDPALGRFMQADSFIPTAQGTQGWDRYAYVNNNPLRYTDPSGHCVGPLLVVCFMVGTWIAENATVFIGIALTGAIVSYIGPSNPDPVLVNDEIAAQQALNQANINALAWLTVGDATLKFGQYYSFPQEQEPSFWPTNNGFEGEPQSITLEPGTQFERIGNLDGRFASPLDTPFGQKSLPMESLTQPLTKFEVLKSIPEVLTGPIAPWFGQPGGGIQYYFKDWTINLLVKNQFIIQIK